jgi:hypothetical protein
MTHQPLDDLLRHLLTDLKAVSKVRSLATTIDPILQILAIDLPQYSVTTDLLQCLAILARLPMTGVPLFSVNLLPPSLVKQPWQMTAGASRLQLRL